MASFGSIIKSNIPVLIDFYADWCAPCKMVAPVLKEVKAHYGDKIKIIKIDVDKNPQISVKYQIRGVPTLMIFKDGQLQWRQAGVVPFQSLKPVIDQFV